MKAGFLFSTILIGIMMAQLHAQDFAPNGAKWYYTEKYAFSGKIDYLMFESIGDTMVNGQKCSVIKNNGGVACNHYEKRDYVYYKDSVAYFFVSALGKFQVLFNLKAKKDSSWTVIYNASAGKLDTIKVVVDSVGYIQINGKKLKKLNVTYKSLNYGWTKRQYPGRIIERLGDTQFLFHLQTLSGLACDGNYSNGLRCYQDSELGNYSTGIASSCTYTENWTGLANRDLNAVCDIFPNPVTDIMTIRYRSGEKLVITISDLSGKVFKKYLVNESTELNLSDLKNGFYLIKLENSGKIIGIRKLAKI